MENTHRTLSAGTLRMYDYYLNKYNHLNIYDPEGNLDILSRTTSVYGDNKKLSASCIKLILSSFVYALKKIDSKESKEALGKYQSYIKDLKKITSEQEADHSRNSDKVPQWKHIIEVRDNELKKGNMKNHLILSLYTYISPRRFKDFILMKIASHKKDMTDTSFNYYDIKNNKFVFNVYKTSKSHGTQIEDVPNNLRDIILRYIYDNQMRNGELLLGFKDYHQLYVRIKKLIGCSVDSIRHSYVNSQYSKKDIQTFERMVDNAESMGHNVQTHVQYFKEK
jgi:hypothetical protein